jgi:N,N-dimethylformamidase beta subunit-like, C-terminal
VWRGLRVGIVVAPLALLVAAPVARTAPARTPDWTLGAAHGDRDEIAPPLTSAQVAHAIERAAGPRRISDLRVTTPTPFAGDRRLLATVSPNGDGLRDQAVVRFRLASPATVFLRVMICRKHPTTVLTTQTSFGAGPHALVWAPPPGTPSQTYRLLVTVGVPAPGCGDHRLLAWLPPAPVVRVMGIDAGFPQATYSPGAAATLRVAADVPSFTLQLFQAGPETKPTLGTAMEGVPVSAPRTVDWSANRNAPATVAVQLGDWANGIYFARLTAPDGRDYYAPFVVRPGVFGAHRIAVVLHTYTWKAYDHYDANGDGWGDTWYAANDIHTVDLSRPYIQGGAPPSWRMYDVPFLHWLYATGKQVDFVSDQDLGKFASSGALAHDYDLIVFPFHEEYVTSHTYDLISGYRDLGGNMIFLSSTNLLWKITRHGEVITRLAEWRKLGRPESSILGVQYRGNDEGRHRGYYQLTPAGMQAWQTAGVDDAALAKWPWLGIEYDLPTSVSPVGTAVLAQVDPHLPNPAIKGDMTYYEQGGAKVFSSGTLNLTSALLSPTFQRLLENVWDRLAAP